MCIHFTDDGMLSLKFKIVNDRTGVDTGCSDVIYGFDSRSVIGGQF